jgi:uncharacterized protein
MIVALCIVLVVLIIIFLYWQDNGVKATGYAYLYKKIPPAFDGFKIVHISDLHNKKFGSGQRRLVEVVQNAAPDMIVISGDLIDCHRTDIESAMELIHAAVQIAPVYYVPGNHECKSNVYGELSPKLQEAGVSVLNNQSAQIRHADATITVLGAIDIEFLKKDKKSKPIEEFVASLTDLCSHKEGFTMLLSHRPEYLELYASQDVDLVFSGHAHGGQVRLPFIGGLFAPGQGWTPAYTSGLYRKDATTLLVSRGLGNSEFPFRVFNRPEVVALTLHTENNS